VRSTANPELILPIISGNVSLYNESAQGAIPPSPIISCLGAMEDYSKALTYDLKSPNSVLILVGQRKNELGGSVYYQARQHLGHQLPRPDLTTLGNDLMAVHQAIQQSLVLSAHTIGPGGAAVALAQMSFKNNLGVQVRLPPSCSATTWLFSETGGFILEISPEKLTAFEQLLKAHSVCFSTLGETTDQPVLVFDAVIHLAVKEARRAWENGLREGAKHVEG
jgi:phosphoribosylformylglycinamidine synthase